MNKFLGQNFLVSKKSIDQVEDLVRRHSTEKSVTEIGFGHLCITEKLSDIYEKVTSLDIDVKLYKQALKEQSRMPNVEFLLEDSTEHEFKTKEVVGNLPFNVSKKIIYEVIKQNLVGKLFVSFQKEVGEKLIRIKSEWGWIVRYYFRPSEAFLIPREAFKPQPKVETMFMVLEREANFEEESHNSVTKFARTIASCKNKKLCGLPHNVLKHIERFVDDAKNKRHHQITLDEFRRICLECFC